MTQTIVQPWEAKRTAQSRLVENELLRAGFQQVDAYRYNSGSIRVRVIDPRFTGCSTEVRDGMVEPHLANLPEEIQVDIVSLFTFAPEELEQSPRTLRDLMMNDEFVNPSPSRL